MTKEFRTCYECGRIIEDGESWREMDGNIVCEDCYIENYTVCDCCNEIVHHDNTTYIDADGDVVCDYCVDHYYVRCANCNDLVRRGDTYGTRDGDVCQCCYDEYYVECNTCGEILHRDDAIYDDWDEYYYCRDCYNEDKAIHNYDYKPEPIFHGSDNNLYMGIELEIDGAGEDCDSARKLLDIDGNDRIYCKHDGSLENGFEIVSHPATLEYHTLNMRWQDILDEAKRLGYTSHDAGTCGLHIHVSREALGNGYLEQELTTAKILYFVEKHWNKMLIFSRRTEYQLNRWASAYGLNDDETPIDVLKKAKSGCGRYKAINLCNSHTIEFRFFRGTLNYISFISTLQLVSNICTYCKALTDAEMLCASWSDFVSTFSDVELLTYLQNKNILED